jgi:outer membrane protein OmpA-like peptidoglycan-associated protein
MTVQASLNTLAHVLNRYPILRVHVHGYAGNQGDPTLNQQLSQHLVDAEGQYLSSRGAAFNQQQSVGLGGNAAKGQ